MAWIEVVLGLLLVLVVVVLVRMDDRLRRNLWRALVIWVTWSWVSASLGLTVTVDPKHLTWSAFRSRKHRASIVRRPKVWPVPTRMGVKVYVRPVAGVGRGKIASASEALSETWRMHRVSVSDLKSGRMLLTGIRYNPLFETHLHAGDEDPRSIRVGVTEYGNDFAIDLANAPGITVGGLSGKGKTTWCHNLLRQLATTKKAQFVILDGKGGGDYEPWIRRCWRYNNGDDMTLAREVVREVYELMRSRQKWVRSVLGVRNAWDVGPSEEWPLVVLVLDECHTFFNGSDKKLSESIAYYVEQIIRRGRSVMMAVVLLTQKQTHDSVPTSIRDNCEVGMCFCVRTAAAAVAALGDDILQYPELNPVNLQGDEYRGVAVVNRPGSGGFVRVKCLHSVDSEVDAVAEGTSVLRTNPTQLLKKMVEEAPGQSGSNVIRMRRYGS